MSAAYTCSVQFKRVILPEEAVSELVEAETILASVQGRDVFQPSHRETKAGLLRRALTLAGTHTEGIGGHKPRADGIVSSAASDGFLRLSSVLAET